MCNEKREPYYLTLFYSVQNCGDGSAYPKFFESEELARFDQDNMDEGWGESCHGDVVIKSDSPIICAEEVYTIDDVIKGIEDDIKDNKRYAIMKDAREVRTGVKESYSSVKYLALNVDLEKQLEALNLIKANKLKGENHEG